MKFRALDDLLLEEQQSLDVVGSLSNPISHFLSPMGPGRDAEHYPDKAVGKVSHLPP